MKLALDVLTVVGGSFMVIWYFVLGPVVTSSLPLVTVVVAAAYPICSLTLVFGAAVVVLNHPVLPLAFLMSGLFLLTLAAAVQHRIATTDLTGRAVRRPARIGTRLPFPALAAGSILLVGAALRGPPFPWVGLIGGGVLMMAAVATRQYIAMRENHHLITRDSLTGLANRVRLNEAIADAVDRAGRTGVRAAVDAIDVYLLYSVRRRTA